MNWKAVDEGIVRELSLYRFGKVLRDDISFDALCEEMSAYDRFIGQKNCGDMMAIQDVVATQDLIGTSVIFDVKTVSEGLQM